MPTAAIQAATPPSNSQPHRTASQGTSNSSTNLPCVRLLLGRGGAAYHPHPEEQGAQRQHGHDDQHEENELPAVLPALAGHDALHVVVGDLVVGRYPADRSRTGRSSPGSGLSPRLGVSAGSPGGVASHVVVPVPFGRAELVVLGEGVAVRVVS